ncbi:hypothetical protein [Zhongshania arctica]|uniref:Uncharacterized protein n=1 Tax=Zhongshania arctica TaxID=3238302 RepID=A0ABV3TVH3_9GAMM
MATEKGPLLGELEELKAVLHKQHGVDLAAIPLLDDIIEDDVDDGLLDSRVQDSVVLETNDLETENMAADNAGTGAFTADTIANEYGNTLIDDSPLHFANDTDVSVDARKSTPSFDSNYSGDGDYGREIFMQEVIDSMMPEIEAELRKRLLSLDNVILQRWHSQLHSDN